MSKRLLLLVFFLTLSLALVNSLHFSYPDEFDNIVGGYFITHGRLPYTGFFTHHGPFAYFLASFIALFSGASFVKFRLLYALLISITSVSFLFYIKKRFDGGLFKTSLYLLMFITVGATYFWGHMLLADSLVGFLLLPVYFILFCSILKRDPFQKVDLIFISILSALALLTSLTFLYAVFIIYIFTTYWYFISPKNSRAYSPLKFFLLLASPYLAFLLYLVITSSLKDYYYQSIFFNKEYYATMPDGSPVRNPLRHAISIFYQFFNHYRAQLGLTKDLNLGSPFNNTLALSNFFILIYLLINRRFSLSILVFGLLVYLNARSDPYSSNETDYQALPYDYFSFFNGLILLHLLWEELKKRLEDGRKIIYGFAFLILSINFIFTFLFLFDKGFDKAYKKYMGTQSLIYNRPAVSSTLNSLLGTDDYYYIGPFAFEDHLYMKSRLASRYFITIPAMDRSEKIKSELLADLNKNRPKVVVFNTEYAIFGSMPGLYLVDFLKQNYFNLEQLKNEGVKFDLKLKHLGDYDFERHFFFDKRLKEELIRELVEKNLITSPTGTASAAKK